MAVIVFLNLSYSKTQFSVQGSSVLILYTEFENLKYQYFPEPFFSEKIVTFF
jgi:hypothetical protein